MEQAEDGDATNAEDEHEEALAEEPFAHLGVGAAEGLIEAAALLQTEETEEEAVGVLAVEHEIEAEEGGGEDVENVREPRRERVDEKLGGGRHGVFGTPGDGVDADAVDHWDSAHAADGGGEALREFGGELLQVTENGRQAEGEEDGEGEQYGGDEDEDGDSARGMAAADGEVGDAVDDGHQDDGKESGDVEHQELFAERPAEGDEQEDEEGEEDVAANAETGRFGVFFAGGCVGIGRCGKRGQGVLLLRNGILPRMGTHVRTDLMQTLEFFDAGRGTWWSKQRRTRG